MCGSPVVFLSAMPFIMDGGGAVLGLGVKGSFPNIPFSFQILEWTLESPLAGNATLDLLCDAYAANSFPTTSIVAAAPPTMAGVKSASGLATTWTNGGNIAAGRSLGFQLTAIATIRLLSLSLKIRRSIV